MKKFLAILLVATVALTHVVNVGLTAASDNTLSNTVIGIPRNSLLIERGSTLGGGITLPMSVNSRDDQISFVAYAGDLQVNLRNELRKGQTVSLELENAKWFFRSTNNVSGISADGYIPKVTNNKYASFSQMSADYGVASSTDLIVIGDEVISAVTAISEIASSFGSQTVNGYLNSIENTKILRDFYRMDDTNVTLRGDYITALDGLGTDLSNLFNSSRSTVSTEHYGDGQYPTVQGIDTTYDTSRGIWLTDSQGSSTGTYFRYGLAPNGSNDSVPYIMSVWGSNDSYANITFLGDAPTGTVIPFPIVSRTINDADIRVRIGGGDSPISGGPYLYGTAGGASTKTYIDDPQEARNEFYLNKLVIRENRMGSIKSGMVEFSLPSGFSFVDAATGSRDLAGVTVSLDPGLAWGSGNTGQGRRASGGVDNDYNLYYKYGYNREYNSIILRLDDIRQSTNTTGSLYIQNLKIVADDDARFGDIEMRVRNVTYDRTGRVEQVVSEESVSFAGKRVDWVTMLHTVGPIPELVNGRYEGTMQGARDEDHRTAHVVFRENAISSWWAGRDTYFRLPDGVKYRKVEITDTKNIQGNDLSTGTYINDAKTRGNVYIDGNSMRVSGVRIQRSGSQPYDLLKASFEMDVWVSIASEFEGDVTMSVEGSGIASDAVPAPIVIARQFTPVRIVTKTTDVKIGYQYYKTADFEIIETKTGALLRNKDVRISISDRISQDMYFAPDYQYEKLESNMRISAPQMGLSGSAYDSFGFDKGSFIGFTVESPSTDKPARIKFTNVSVKVDRTVPESAKPYDLVVWGTAVAGNYNATASANRDNFSRPGVRAPYIMVVSSADDKVNTLNAEVRVAIGERYYTSNGQVYEMDAEAYISESTNSTMVPIRFVANAFGYTDQQILWDDSIHVVSIIDAKGRVIQFQAGNDKMIVNGTPITIMSPDQQPVKAEIRGNRMYLPFRALGDAFGVPVTWDAESRTAIFNQGLK